MLSHRQIWLAIDTLAQRHSLTPSGLAKRAGLDPTTFNKSKRQTSAGRLRWPNTESIAKVLSATGTTMEEFMAYTRELGEFAAPRHPVPLIGLTQAGHGGFFDDGGFPLGGGWDEVDFPAVQDRHAYALEVTGESMLPLYRDGDIVIVSPAASIRRGDRVIVKTRDGEVMAKVLARRSARVVELHSLNPEHEPRVLPLSDVEWIARIVWASQ